MPPPRRGRAGSVSPVNRRVLISCLAAAATLSSCTTFSDNDAVARVGDVELSSDELTALVGGEDNLVIGAEAARAAIGGWIRDTVQAEGLYDEASIEPATANLAGPRYDAGFLEGAVSCPLVLVTLTFDDAREARTRLNAGEPFAEVFAALNIDPSIAPTGGDIGCVDADGLALNPNDQTILALLELSADNPIVTRRLAPETESGTAVVLVHRSYMELTDPQLDAVAIAVGAATVRADLDIYVDPRFGTFVPAAGQVVPTGAFAQQL